jgi:hypothetical protein
MEKSLEEILRDTPASEPLLTYYDFRDKGLMGYTHLIPKMREINPVEFDKNTLKLKQEYISYMREVVNDERT